MHTMSRSTVAPSAMSTHADIRRRLREQLALGRAALGEGAVRELLHDILPFGDAVVCESPADAGPAAERLGFPVVVKALTSALLHKSDLGLVVAGCTDAEQARDAAELVARRARAAAPRAPVEISVQRELAGVEIALGIRRDELGPLVMVAAGGTLIELLDDSAVAMAPVSRERARELVGTLRASKLLEGYRGASAIDAGPLVELLVELSGLAAAVPEIAELDLNPVFVSVDGALAADARCVLRPAAEPGPGADRRDPASVRAIFEPRRIAVIGASADERKVGGLVMRYLRKHRWAGEIIAVNPKGVDLPGVISAPSIQAINGPVDLACIAVSANALESVVRDCVEHGIPSGVIFTAGFAETGEEGALAQARLLEATAGRFRFVGPNSNGAASPGDRLFATFGMALEADDILAGEVGFVSQSGAIASSMISRSAEFGVGFSHWISAGNEADLDVADYLEYLVEDPATKVICLFLEVVRRPRAFAAACERALEAGKPVVALKSGRSEAGRAAAASHTGALTGSAVAYRAFLEECGVIVVDDLNSLLSAAQGLLSAGAVAGPRVGVISMSGGACSIIADAAASARLEVPALPEETQQRLRELLPEFGGVRNPVDVTAQGITRPELVQQTLTAVRTSGAVDLVLVQLSTNADPAAAHMATDLVAASGEPGAPFLVGRLGSPSLAPNAMQTYGAAGMHVFTWPDDLVAAAQACADYGALRRRWAAVG